MKLAITKIISVAVIALPAFICAADPILLQSRFNLDEVEWIKDKGNSSISGLMKRVILNTIECQKIKLDLK